MKFNIDYSGPMDRAYYFSPVPRVKDIEAPISTGTIGVGELGRTVTEGRGEGTMLDSVRAAVFEGVANIELAPKTEGAEPFVGVESYGREARRDLKEMAEINKLVFTSVHTPPEVVGNLSGFARNEFNPRMREHSLNEVKKAIEFAADVGARAIVVHTGEFQRPFIEQEGEGWKDEKGREMFREFLEEPARGTVHLVDTRTGQVISEVARNQIVHMPKIRVADHDYDVLDKEGVLRHVKKGDPVDYTNRPVFDEKEFVPEYDSEHRRFVTEPLTWDDFKKRASEYNKKHDLKPGDSSYRQPEKEFIDAHLTVQERQSRGWELYHSQHFDEKIKALNQLIETRRFFKQVEDKVPESEKWKILRESPISPYIHSEYLRGERLTPVQIIDKTITQLKYDIEHTREAAVSYAQQAEEIKKKKQFIRPIGEYAFDQSIKSYAEVGLYAMKISKEKKLGEKDKDVFVAPENIFPEMGFGSHPQELKKLVLKARERMVEYLTAKEINDPTGKVDLDGRPIKIENPYRIKGISQTEARDAAEKHIKATLDTQHLGMWWRHFQPMHGETEEQAKKRFNTWYLDQIKSLEKEGIIGHLHIVDGFGRAHAHIEAGQGLTIKGKKDGKEQIESPVISAVEYLKKKGYKGTMVSEAFGGVGRRNITQTWAAFGSPIYSYELGALRPGAPERWTDIWQSYFSRTRTPYFIFGAYSPSEEFKLWTEVPLE